MLIFVPERKYFYSLIFDSLCITSNPISRHQKTRSKYKPADKRKRDFRRGIRLMTTATATPEGAIWADSHDRIARSAHSGRKRSPKTATLNDFRLMIAPNAQFCSHIMKNHIISGDDHLLRCCPSPLPEERESPVNGIEGLHGHLITTGGMLLPGFKPAEVLRRRKFLAVAAPFPIHLPPQNHCQVKA